LARIHSPIFFLAHVFADYGTIFLRFGVPVCPHAGGVGLCEYVIHLRWGITSRSLSTETLAEVFWQLPGSLIDYIAVSGTMERNVLEYVDHLHEHFLYPCSINERGRYNVPNNPVEGYRLRLRADTSGDSFSLYFFPIYSIEMYQSSIAEYGWPNGSHWAKAKAKAKAE
jgi:L-fuconate dehydratase